MRFRLTALFATSLLVASCSAQEGTNANTTVPIPDSGTPAAVASGADQGGNQGGEGSTDTSPGAEDCATAVESVGANVAFDELDQDSDAFDEAIEACGSLDELRVAAEEQLPGLDTSALEAFLAERCGTSDDVSSTPVCEELVP